MDIYTGLRKSTTDESFEAVKKFFLEATEASGLFKERMDKLIDHNMKGTSNSNVQIIPYLFAQLNPKATEEELFQAQIIGWIFAFMGIGLFIADDICDKTKTRNGIPCWYLLPGVGKTAVLDTNMLLSFVPLAINHFFRHHPCYSSIALVANRYCVTATKGQFIDTEDNHKTGSHDINIERFTWDRYKDLCLNKATIGELLCLPFYLSGETNEPLCKELRKLGSHLSLTGQIINDYDDVFPSNGSPGTDIEEGKLTWCIIKALEKASLEQRKIIEENYGKKDKKCIRAVKKLFRELDLKKDFAMELESKEEIEEILASVVKASKESTLWNEKGIPSSYVTTISKYISAYKQNHSLLHHLWG